ncbi:coil containing protein [Vibrio phage 1.205.O._10N.222.51.A7]|nr:coil containing protein [Vibrio phage 1.205.O._10N.222.51.A7]
MMPDFWDRQFSQVKAGNKPALTIDEMQERDKPELALSDSNVEKQVDIGAADVGKAAVSGVLGWGESVAEAAAKPGFTAEQQQQVIEEGYSPESVAVLDANKNILELVAKKGRDWFSQNKEAVRESMSVNAKKALEAELINENLSFTDDAAKLSTWIMKGTETLSRMVPDLALGGMGSKQIYSQTFEMMLKKGVEKGLSREAAKIAADKAAKGAMSATTAQMATISATGGAGVQVRETIENTPWNELTKSETFKANFSAIDQDPQYKDMSDKEKLNLARTMTADQAATNVQQDPALLAVNAVSSFLGDATLGRIIQGRIGGGIAEKAIKGFAAEAPTEAGQGAMEQYAQNMVLIDVAGSDIDPTKGVARAALEGAVLGGAIGGGVGGATGVAEKVTGREQVIDMPEDPTATAAEPEVAPVEPEVQKTVAERREELDEKIRGQRVTSGLGDVQEALAGERAPTVDDLLAEARTQPGIEPEAEVQTEAQPKTVAERREAMNQRLESQRAEYESKRIEAGEGEVQSRLSRPAAPSVEELIAKAPAETGPTPGELEFRSQQNREYLEGVKTAKIPQAMRNKPGATRLLNKGYRKAMEDIGSLAGKMSGKKELSPEVDTMTKAIERLGGLQRDLSEAEGMDPASFKRNRLFPATGGMTFDHAAEVLNEQGYKNREGGRLSANDVVDMVYGEANNNERHLSSYADADMLTADADMVRQWSDEIGGTDKLNTAITKALKGEKLGKRQAEIVGEVLDTINAIRSDDVDLAKQELQSRREEREQRRVDEFNKAYQELTEVDDSALYDYERYAESFGEMPDHFTDQQELLSELVSNAGDRDYQATEQLITGYDNGDVSLPSLLDQLSEIASRETTYEQAKPSIQTVSKPAPQRVERSDEARTEAIEPAPAVEPTAEPEPAAAEPTATAEPEQRVEPEPTAPDGLETVAKPGGDRIPSAKDTFVDSTKVSASEGRVVNAKEIPSSVLDSFNNAEQARAWIENNASDPVFREIASSLTNRIPGDIGFEHSLSEATSSGMTKGVYRYSERDGVVRTNKVIIYPKGKNESTVMHELIHAATSHIIRNPETQTQIEAIAKIKDLMVHIDARQFLTRDLTIEEKNAIGSARRNVDEFVTHTLTHPAYQSALKKIKPQTQKESLFSQFASAIKKLLGVKVSDGYFEQAIDLTTRLIDATPGREKTRIETKAKVLPDARGEFINSIKTGTSELETLTGDELSKAANRLSNKIKAEQRSFSAVVTKQEAQDLLLSIDRVVFNKGKEAEAKQEAEAKPTTEDFANNTYQQWEDVSKKAVEGDLTPEQYNEAAKQFLADKDRIQAEINKAETKPKLIKKLGPMAAYRAKSEKKDYAVNAYYQQLMARFHIDGGVISYSMGKNAYENAIIKSTEGLTQSDIDTYKTELAKKREEYSSRFKQAAKSIKNPETLAEFKEYLQYKSEGSLTPEQRSRYDELITAERMEKTGEAKKAKAVKAGLETDEAVSVESMEPGKHGKTGEPIINVKLSKLGKDQFKQAAAQARSMKGGYWRGSFYLPDQASADQFVAWAKGESIDRTESVTKGEEIKQKSVVSKLETMAEKLKATAEADLNVDRRENTVRQMRQADSSRGKAEKQVQLADMMNMIAKGFEDGSVKYLSGITSKAQLEEVIRSYDALKYNIPNPSNNDLVSMDNMTRPYWNDSTTVEQKVQFARLPFADLNGYMIGELAKRMGDVTGYKQAANQLAKIAKQTGDRNYTTLDVNAPYFAKALDFAKKQGKHTTFADQAERFSRLQRMGIDNGSALRASLIELDSIKGKLKEPKQKTTVETMERDLKRKIRLNRNAFNDFFPTPQTISQDIIDLADIKEGMKVLEPSAGNGELAQAISNAGGDLDVVELAGDLRNILTEKGFNLVGDDFLNYSTGADYDRIVMNPPFSNDQDIDHIYHAFNMLKPGGRIVAITSSMAGDRSNNKNKQFREWLDNLNAEEADLPSDAFMDSLNPTGVNTKVITIDKPVKSNGDDRAQFSQNSRTTGTPKGVSIKEAELLAGQFLKKYKGAAGAKVKVFATQSEALAYGGIDLPEDVRVNAYRIPQTGEIVLIAENLDNARDVWQKLRHEILAHHGLYNLVGESEWRKIMSLVSQSRESGELKEVWDQIDTNYPELREDLKAEEVIAHIAEYEPGKMGEFADRIISAVIRALRNIGLINPGMMQVEIRDLIRVVGQRIKSLDSANGSIRNDVMFSREVAEPSGFSIPDETRKDRFLRGIADKYRRLKVVQESVKEQGGRITEGEDVYLAEELFHGKIGEDMRSMEADYIKPLQDAMIEKNVDAQELDLYLIARHAPERNAHIAEINPKMQDGGSGMTNAEASEIMSRFESEGKTADMEAAAVYVDKMLKSTRDRLVESGLETIDAVESWDSAYQFYVPLKGFANNEVDTEGNSVKPTGRGFNIRGKETMKAMGRRTMAESPVAYAISDATQSMMRARKNEVGQTLLRLVDANHDPELWQVFSDENPDIIRRITKQRDPVTGRMRDQVIDAPAPMFALKDQYLGVKMNGEQYYIKLNDVRLMEAMSNLGVEQANLLTKTLGRVTRMLSALITSYNPEFALSNLARDIQTAMYNVLAESEVKGGKAEGARGLASQIAKDVASGRSFKALKKGLRDNNFEGEWGEYFKEYLDSGAKTGYFVQKEIEEIKNDIQKSIAKTGPGAVNALLRSKDKVIKFVDDYNDVIENASRLSVYVNSRKQGFTKKQAASLAKNLTVNFNRRGEMTNNINALYMFFNASVQGTMNMLRAVATPKDKSKSMFNPGFYNTTQKIAMMLPIATMMAGALNRSIGGEDDDGKAFYDKVPDFVKETNFVLMIPGSEGDYIKIPMPYGYNFFASVGLAVDKSINGDQTAIESGFDLVSAFAGAFNPLGITDSEEGSVQAVKMASPSVMKPFVEMATNENFYGGPLYKQQNPFGLKLPDSYNAQRRTWELAKGVSEWLNDATGGNEFKSGYVDIAPESFQHLLSFMGGGLGTLVGRTQDLAAKGIKGEEIEDKDVPFWRKYFGNISDSVDVAEMYDRFDAVKEAQRQLEGLPKKEALKYRANNTGLIRLIPLQKTINKELTKLNKRRREIESSKLSDERKKVIVDNIEEKKRLLASKFNKKYNDLVGE